MYKALSHVGHLVKDLDAALAFYRDVLGLVPNERGIVELRTANGHLRTAVLPLANNAIELIQPVGTEGPIAQYLAERGEGLYHVALVADNYEQEIQDIQNKGIPLVVKTFEYAGQQESNAFFSHHDTMGVPIEVINRSVHEV